MQIISLGTVLTILFVLKFSACVNNSINKTKNYSDTLRSTNSITIRNNYDTSVLKSPEILELSSTIIDNKMLHTNEYHVLALDKRNDSLNFMNCYPSR